MKYHRRDGEQYLKKYPELWKWMNECSICHAKGYKPEMPEHISSKDSTAAQNLKQYFRILEVNEFGVCQQCAKFMGVKNGKITCQFQHNM